MNENSVDRCDLCKRAGNVEWTTWNNKSGPCRACVDQVSCLAQQAVLHVEKCRQEDARLGLKVLEHVLVALETEHGRDLARRIISMAKNL